MWCAVILAVLLTVCRMGGCGLIPDESSSTTTEQSTTIDPSTIHVSVMGEGLQKIPQGKCATKILNLAYNHLTVLPEFAFSNNSYKALTTIELYQNRIRNISLSAFRGLRQLTTIDLKDNNLTAIDPYTFKFNTKLEKLDLSTNKIAFNRVQVFLVSQSLETLILTNNRIDQLYEVTLMALPNLKNLILDRNALFMIAANSFKPLSKLQYLSVANTGVYRLSESMFDDLPRIIDLQETPLAKRFDPPLRKVTNNAVQSLINIDKYIYISDTPVH